MALTPWNAAQTVNTTTNLNQGAARTTQLANGTIVVSWVDSSGLISQVKFQRFDAIGNKLGVETIVHGAIGGAIDNLSSTDVVALSDGGFVVGVIRTQFGDVKAQKFLSNGVANGAEIAVTAVTGVLLGDKALNLLALPNNEFAAFYHGFNSVLGTSGIDINGTIVSAAGVAGPRFFTQFPELPDLVFSSTLASNGDILLAYETVVSATESRLYLQQFSSTGVQLGNSFINFASNYHVDPDITALSDGNYVVSFTKDRAGTGPADIVAGIYNLAQNTLIEFFTVNTTILGEQTRSKVTALADGKFMVVYLSTSGGTTNIHAQAFNPDGSKSGGELVIDADVIGQFPDVVSLADGRVAVTWTDNAGSSANDVRMQIIDPREGIFNGTANADKIYGNDAGNDWFHGNAGADTIYGLRGNDTLFGDAGADTLYGGKGDDTVYGGADSDSMVGGLGADEIYGDAGSDTIFFTSSRSGVTVNLLTGEGSGGEAEGDSYFAVENIVGSGFADVLTAGTAAATLDGRAGSDTLTGSALADVFIGGAGADTINGLGGIDGANYTGSLFAVQINLATNINTGGDALGDKLSSIEIIYGSSLGDSIIGNTANNTFLGFGGKDRLDGGIGADVLSGGLGSDSFVFKIGQSGQLATTLDKVTDYAKGAVGVGDKFDFATKLIIGGSAAAASATQASISATTGVATFLAGSGTTLADALLDIATRMTTAGNLAGEFAFFKVNNTGNFHLFISAGVAGVGANDVLVQMTGITTIGTINLTAGDLTILT